MVISNCRDKNIFFFLPFSFTSLSRPQKNKTRAKFKSLIWLPFEDTRTFLELSQLLELSRDEPLEPVSRRSRKLFGLEKPFVKLREFKKRRRLQQRQRHKAVILLVKRIKMIVLHVRNAFLYIFLPFSSKIQRKMTKFKVLTTTWANYGESFSLTLYFKSVRTYPVLGHLAHIE